MDPSSVRRKSRATKPPSTKKQACPAAPPVPHVATNPKPASRQMIDSLAKYTAWLGVHNICLRHDDQQGRYAVRSVKTERGTCVLKEQPLMHWLLPDVGNACAFCLKQLGTLQPQLHQHACMDRGASARLCSSVIHIRHSHATQDHLIMALAWSVAPAPHLVSLHQPSRGSCTQADSVAADFNTRADAGKNSPAHRPKHAAPWETYCCASHAAADVQVASIMAVKESAATAHSRSARVLRYCAALQTLDNPVALAKRFQVCAGRTHPPSCLPTVPPHARCPHCGVHHE